MHRKRSLQELAALCAQVGPDDGVDPRKILHNEYHRKDNRKTQQLCKQAAIAIGLALAAETRESLLRDLQVAGVEPAPDASRLKVVVCPASPSASLASRDVLSVLESISVRLRAEVANAIHRKRAPLLCFEYCAAAEVKP